MGKQRHALSQRTRQTSPHVTSRWYRSPEIILTDRFYGSKCDVWAVGCILADLLKFLDQNKKAYQPDNWRHRVLFPGSCCHPLTPVTSQKQSQAPSNSLVIDEDD